MKGSIGPGQRLPAAKLATLTGDTVVARSARDIFTPKRAIIVGIPGAFTPVCTRSHIPGFIDHVASIKASGFDIVACIAPNDPWTLAAWAQMVDPSGQLEFLSDGNLEFARACGLLERHEELFLGDRMCRFRMIVIAGIVEKIAIETSILDVTCSAAEASLS